MTTKSELRLENFLRLKQPVLYLENIEKINDVRLAPVNGANNLDAAMQIIFSKPRDGTLFRLCDSYLECTFTYNTQSPVGTANDGADITFHNDLFSKMFDTMELVLGGTPIETIYWSNIANEIVGLVCYSSDEDRSSGVSFGWIPDYGSGSSELTLSGLVAALSLVTAIPTTAAINTNINSLTLAGTAPGGNIPAINNSGYFRRKIFYNKPQSVLGGAIASTSRTCTLCIPLGHLFQSVTSYDKLIYNINLDLRLTRTGATSSNLNALGTSSGINVGRLVYSQTSSNAFNLLPAGSNAAAVNGTITQSMGFQTLSLNWIIPQYRLTELGKSLFLKQTEHTQDMVTLIRVTQPKYTTSSSNFTYDLGARANVPRYILVGFKQNTTGGYNMVDKIYANSSLYTHAYVTDIYITIGSERYPYSPLQCDFPNNKYAMAYQMFRQFCNKMGVSTSLDYIDFRDRFPIFCFDLSARPAVLDTNTTSVNVQLNVVRNPPNNVDQIDVYPVLFCERVFELNYISGSCTTSQRI